MREADIGHTGHDSTDGKLPEQADHRHREWVPVCQRLGGGRGGDLLLGTGFLLEDRVFWNYTEVMVI